MRARLVTLCGCEREIEVEKDNRGSPQRVQIVALRIATQYPPREPLEEIMPMPRQRRFEFVGYDHLIAGPTGGAQRAVYLEVE